MSDMIDFPDEVITSAPVHYVDLPGELGTLALITLDNGFDHTKPTTLGPKSLANIGAAIDEALGRDDVVAVAVTGKPFIFAVGADKAVTVIVENAMNQNRMLRAQQAFDLGIADVLLEPADSVR